MKAGCWTCMRPDDVREAAAWLDAAREDLSLARHLVGNRAFPRQASYHAQQAGEKAFKAVLTAHGAAFPKTHDLIQLHALLPAGTSMAVDAARADLALLTGWAVRGRYPHTGPAAMAAEAEAAVADATILVDAAIRALAEHSL